MNTGNFITPDIIVFDAAIKAGDKKFKMLHRGFYYAQVQKAFERLAMDTYFDEKRKEIVINESLIHDLPEDCFNVRHIYLYTGTECNIATAHKLWWKRTYWTGGQGYLANDRGRNMEDPFYENHDTGGYGYGNRQFTRAYPNVNSALFYNFQQGKLMISSSCLARGEKLQIHYSGTGCPIGEAPIIPIYLRDALIDFVTVEALSARIANEKGDTRNLQSLLKMYRDDLNRPFTGSWEKAEYRVKSLNASQREDLKEYLSRGAWSRWL